MIRTADDMYARFLYGIDKEGTTTVYPEKFNELINEAQGLVVNEMADEVQVNRRRMDDLNPITRRYTNETTITPPVGNPVTGYPKTLPADYFRELNIKFKLLLPAPLVGKPDNKTLTEDFYWGVPMRADNKPIALNNPYRSTNTLFEDGKVYYEVMNNSVDVVDYEFQEYKMDYLIVPPKIVFREEFSTTHPTHDNCVLSGRMQQIIVDRAVRIFIERTENVRYQTAYNEDTHKNF